MGQLIAARVVQGFGGGAIQALAFAILGDILPPRERGRYIGYFTLAFVGAALLGPLIGGFIIDHWSWPWIFFINIPLAAHRRPWSATSRCVCRSRAARPASTSPARLLLSVIDRRRLMIGLEEGGTTAGRNRTSSRSSPSAPSGWSCSSPSSGGRREPMIPLHLFANPVVLACVVAGMCAGTIAFGAGQFLPALLPGLAVRVADRVRAADAAADDRRHASGRSASAG